MKSRLLLLTIALTFVFDNTTKVAGPSGGGPAAAALVEKMSEAWIVFARSGNPGTSKLPRWPAYTGKARDTMIFDNERPGPGGSRGECSSYVGDRVAAATRCAISSCSAAFGRGLTPGGDEASSDNGDQDEKDGDSHARPLV